MNEALLYTREQANTVSCMLCSHHCRIKEGRRGICGVRENRDGRLYSLVYGRLAAENIDPIEKKPLFHFLPASHSYSIATVGCNFFCRHCQNYRISQYPHMNQGEIAGNPRTPEQVVDAAQQSGCRSISYTYVEPTIFYEFARDCMVLAHERGIANVFVSNGYMTPECARELAPLLDGINIDIKAFTEDFYRTICKAHLQPVLDSVQLMKELGVWVETTTLLIPGLNDAEEELRGIASFIHAIDPAIPWHVTAFRPAYKLTDRGPTPVSSLRLGRQIGQQQGLRFVYEGNIPGEGGENTYCPSCGTELVSRFGFSIRSNNIKNGTCSACGEQIEGVWQYPS